MLLWIGLAVLVAGVVAALTRPLFRGSAEGLGAAEADIAVFRDQLREIDADHERGALGEAEAVAARAELARRLIRRSESAGGATGTPLSPRTRQHLAMMTAALIPIASLGLYLTFGSPALPARPHAERASVPPEKASIADLLAQVEARLREHPEDGRGWDVVAPVYLKMQRYSDAADAYARAIRLLGETPQRLSGFGEASILAKNGVVSEDARRAFERVVALDPANALARFWLALAKEQDGDLEAAAAGYKALLDDAPADASWREAVSERLAAINRRLGREAPAQTPAQSSAADMTAEERQAFIEQMVSGLAERLKKDGKDLDGWLRLARSYSVLGRPKDASQALAEARRNFADDEKSLAAIDALAKSLGLGS